MKPAVRSLTVLAASLALLLAPATGVAESRVAEAGQPGPSAALDFRIIIPPVMRVLEHSHPSKLDANADGTLGAEQRLVVLSNMKRGFCVTLRLAHPGVGPWQIDTSPESSVAVQAAGDGYRLCSARPGRHTLVLLHRFGRAADGQTAALAWPVQTDITTL
jgi:hypothetical protein